MSSVNNNNSVKARKEGIFALRCAVCGNLPMDVVDSKCCASLFCWECGTSIDKCPTCQTKIDWSDLQANSALQKLIDTMEVKCKYEGCSSLVLVSTRLLHEAECGYKPCICPNTDLCGILLSKDLNNHLQNECPERAMECPYNCGNIVKMPQMMEHIQKSCDCVEMECTNHCGRVFKKKEIADHLKNQCPNTLISCEFVEFGCACVSLRSDYQEHLDKNVQTHLRLVLNAVKVQQKEIESLKEKLDNPVEGCKMDFAAALEQAKVWTSTMKDQYKNVPSDCCNWVYQQGGRVIPTVRDTCTKAVQEYTNKRLWEAVVLILLFSFFVPCFISKIALYLSIFYVGVAIYRQDSDMLTRWVNVMIAALCGRHFWKVMFVGPIVVCIYLFWISPFGQRRRQRVCALWDAVSNVLTF